jgi:hypothetical protein
MMHIRPFRACLLVAALGAGAAASASVDLSPAPGGVYRLKPGIYVARGSGCDAPANAAIRQYDGHGIATAHSRACKARIRARQGSRYTVDQTCIDAGAGPGRRETERQHILVRDALSFTQTIRGSSTTYSYCPLYQLPPDLRPASR